MALLSAKMIGVEVGGGATQCSAGWVGLGQKYNTPVPSTPPKIPSKLSEMPASEITTSAVASHFTIRSGVGSDVFINPGKNYRNAVLFSIHL